MINKTTLTQTDNSNINNSMRSLITMLGILGAFVPLLVLGFIGTRLGAGTPRGGMLITLGYGLSVTVATAVLKLQGSSWRDIGLSRPQSWMRTLLFGLGTLVGAILVINVVTAIALNLPGVAAEPPDVSRFNPMENNLPLLLGYLVLAWTAIAFGEEMLFRAFLTTQLTRLFHNTNANWALATLGSSILFGLAHYQEGLVGMLSNGAFGFLLCVMYLMTGRNLWVTIIAHGLLNTLRFVLVFSGVA